MKVWGVVKVRLGINLNPHLVLHLSDSSLPLIHLSPLTQTMPPRVWAMAGVGVCIVRVLHRLCCGVVNQFYVER